MNQAETNRIAWRTLFQRLKTSSDAQIELLRLERETLRARVAELEAALRYAGKHPEDCVAGEPGPCTSHMAYLEVEAERDGYVCPGCGRPYASAPTAHNDGGPAT
jgi:hypothetical protein